MTEITMKEPEPPTWLDTSLVQEALRRGGDEDTVVKSVTLRPVGAAGDNYGSTMFRITAETTAETRSLICKTPSFVVAFKDLTDEYNVFRQEGFVMSEIIPAMEKLLEDAAPGRFQPFAARCPHYGDKPQDFLFIEDLAPQGFRLADRKRGLGLRHSLLALRTLGYFHAASAALLARDPSLEKKLLNFLEIDNPTLVEIMTYGYQTTADACRKWPDFPKECVDALVAAKGVAWDKFRAIHTPSPDRFNVIIHCDFWVNNLMFRYEDGEVRDMRMVDFQGSHVASPVVDLLYFLGASVSEDVSMNHIDLLLREYYVALKDTLELLAMDVPSFEDLLEDFNAKGFYITYGATGVLPIVRAEKAVDFDKALSGDTDAIGFAYETPQVKRWLCRALPEYLQKGWLA